MIMLERDEKEIYETIATLENAFSFSCKELNESRTMLEDKHSEAKATSARLKALSTDYRIGDKKIKNAETEIALFRKKMSEMDSGLDSVDRELKRTNDELEKLSAKKNDLMENLAGIGARLRQTSSELTDSEKESHEILSAIKRLDAQKAGLSAEISDMLSNASIVKIQEDKELEDFSLNFGKLALEREDAKKIFAKREEVLSGLRDEIALLKQKCASVEEVLELEKEKDLLKTDVKKLEEERRTNDQIAKELQDALSDKEEELKLLSSGKIEKENVIGSLENEVGLFDDLVAKVQDRENRLGESESLVEKAISDVKNLFVESRRIEQELLVP